MFVLVVSVWSISISIELPVKSTVIEWSALPVCVVSISLLFPVISQLLIQPTTSQVAFILLLAPLIIKSWLPPVAVAAAPCVQTKTLLSPPEAV